MSYTLFIVIITALISFLSFNNQELYNKFIFYPYLMDKHPEQYYRALSSGFIHADLQHLLFNMISLWFFGAVIENIFAVISHKEVYLLLYFSGIIVSSIPSFIKHRNHSYFRSLGASGGVSAILFSTVYFEPWDKIFIIFIPIGIPAIIYAVLYVAYTWYMSKKGNDNINHDAHLLGSIYGFVFAFIVDLGYSHGHSFINQIIPRF